MNLILFFRLILMSIFQSYSTVIHKVSYDNTLFYCPVVHANDGFNVSLQIHHGNYCESNNGYRVLGDTMVSVEFGFTSIHEPLMDEYAETPGDTTTTVGRIPITVLEDVFKKHGGINWEKTLSVEAFKQVTKS